jgi:hypothetical protein
MKALIILSILWLNAWTGHANERSYPDSVADPAKRKIRILVVGFGKGNLLSNYYMDDSLSKFTNIPQEILHQSFSSAVVGHFRHSMSPKIEFLTLEDSLLSRKFLGSIHYTRNGEERMVDFSDSPVEELLESRHANYLLFINQYEINYMGSPYKTFYYIVRYSLVSNTSEKIHEGRVFFENPEIVPLPLLVKKHEKQAQKIANQTEKLLGGL